MTRLASFGPLFVVAALPAVYSVNRIYETLVSIKKTQRIKKNSPTAQTMRLVSFGPVFVVAALPAAYFVNRSYETLVSIKKKRRILKKTYLGPKRRVWHCLGPFSS
jgi:hypothetical protein